MLIGNHCLSFSNCRYLIFENPKNAHNITLFCSYSDWNLLCTGFILFQDIFSLEEIEYISLVFDRRGNSNYFYTKMVQGIERESFQD